jgi:hypothetical protein
MCDCGLLARRGELRARRNFNVARRSSAVFETMMPGFGDVALIAIEDRQRHRQTEDKAVVPNSIEAGLAGRQPKPARAIEADARHRSLFETDALSIPVPTVGFGMRCARAN